MGAMKNHTLLGLMLLAAVAVPALAMSLPSGPRPASADPCRGAISIPRLHSARPATVVRSHPGVRSHKVIVHTKPRVITVLIPAAPLVPALVPAYAYDFIPDAEIAGRVTWVEKLQAGAAPVGDGVREREKAAAVTHLHDAEAVPGLDERGREGYRTWLGKKLPRAFVVAQDGTWYSTWGIPENEAGAPRDPAERALHRCTRAGKPGCSLYAIDTTIVWKEPAQPREARATVQD